MSWFYISIWRKWELFHLESDPAELTDVAADHPELVKELITAYDQWAIENGVLSPEAFDALRRQ